MANARKIDRIRSLLSAQVLFNKGASTIDCVIRNVSPAGARLEIGDSMALPAEFDLDIPHKGRAYRARIIWRGEGMVGVEFIDPAIRTGQSSANETESERVDRLMVENAKLKTQVLELKQRVALLTDED